MQPVHAPVRPGDDMARFPEGPALAVNFLKVVGERHEWLELFQRAHQGGAMRPRAGDGAVEVIAAGLGRKRGPGFAADAIAEDELALEVQPLVVVIEEDVLLAPFAIDELSH